MFINLKSKLKIQRERKEIKQKQKSWTSFKKNHTKHEIKTLVVTADYLVFYI